MKAEEALAGETVIDTHDEPVAPPEEPYTGEDETPYPAETETPPPAEGHAEAEKQNENLSCLCSVVTALGNDR